MSFLQAVTPYDIHQFLSNLTDTSLTADELRRINDHREVRNLIVDAIRSHPEFALIHGMYNRPEHIHRTADAIATEAGYDPDNFVWIGDPDPPSFDEEDKCVVVALFDMFDSPARQAEVLWQRIRKDHWGIKPVTMAAHAGRLSHFQDPEFRTWQPGTRRWVKMRLFCHQGQTIQWMREHTDARLLPGLEVLAAIAQHPVMPEESEKENYLVMPSLNSSFENCAPVLHISRGGRTWRPEFWPEAHYLDKPCHHGFPVLVP